jgi:hypothetical protein
MAKDDNMEGGQMIAYIAIAVIAISLFVIGMRFTGFVVTDTSVLNVTITPTAAINFTSDFINFGAGSVNLGAASATLESDQTSATGGTWSYSAQHFVLENIGNLNVSLKLKTGKTAAQFLGGTSPTYKYKVADTETGSCTGGYASSWTEVSTSGSGDTICDAFRVASANDKITIDVQLVVPSDSDSGTGGFTDTFTAEGTSL